VGIAINALMTAPATGDDDTALAGLILALVAILGKF